MISTYERILESIINRASYKKFSSFPSSSSSKLDISISTDFTTVTLNGLTKTVDYWELMKILYSQDIIKKEESIAPIFLPYGTFATAFDKSTLTLSCYYPEAKRTISHRAASGKAINYTVPFPNTIISFLLSKDTIKKSNWKVDGVYYFVTPKSVTQLPVDKIITAKSQIEGIFEMPFTNFYNGGKMCYGGNTMPVYHTNNLRGLDYYFQVIFNSAFNNDLGIRNIHTPKEVDYRTPSKYYKWLSTLETFPYDLMY